MRFHLKSVLNYLEPRIPSEPVEHDIDYSKRMKHITCRIALEWADILLEEAANNKEHNI